MTEQPSRKRKEKRKLIHKKRDNKCMKYRAFSCDVMSAILVYQISPVGVELFYNAKTFFCFIKQIWPLVT